MATTVTFTQHTADVCALARPGDHNHDIACVRQLQLRNEKRKERKKKEKEKEILKEEKKEAGTKVGTKRGRKVKPRFMRWEEQVFEPKNKESILPDAAGVIQRHARHRHRSPEPSYRARAQTDMPRCCVLPGSPSQTPAVLA
jgi:hypothetical protein